MAAIKAADTDGSGAINYTEFLAATIDANIFMRRDLLQNTFKMFDILIQIIVGKFFNY